jgi:hypothetical protein
MNEVAERPTLQSGGMVRAIVPSSIDEVVRLSKYIAKAGWCPKGYLVDPKNASSGFDEAKITLGIMHGLEVGLTPIAALQSIAVINGTPALFGDGMLALVQKSGLLEDYAETAMEAGGKFVGYKVFAKRKHMTTPFEASFTLDDAAKAKLTGKLGPWSEYPKRMCMWRARAWALRAGFADVLRGLHSAEEVLDMVPVSAQPPAPSKPPRSAVGALDAFAGAPVEDAVVKQPVDEVVDEDGVISPSEPSPMPVDLAVELAGGKWANAMRWVCDTFPTLDEEHRDGFKSAHKDLISVGLDDPKQGAKVEAALKKAGIQ